MRSPVPLDDATVGDYLRRTGIAPPGVELSVAPAGDGNINWVRRARAADGRSWIVKQARPALERFPQYRASTERIVFEARYFELTRPLDGEGVCPRVLLFDAEARVLVLEDLGAAERLDDHLARGADATAALRTLGSFLGRAHAALRGPDLGERFRNDEMRRLHGDHIFRLPFQPNDFELSAPVRARAERLWADAELCDVAARAYARYLRPQGALLHGDVQAGNVLLPSSGPKLLDAEIAHIGDPAFDAGTLLAHLLLPAVASGATARARAPSRALWSAYRAAHGADGCPLFADVALYAGIEMMRRTIGAARVRAVAPPEAALAVVTVAERLMRRPPAAVEDLLDR